MGFFSNLSQQKSPTAEIIGIYFLRTIVPRKYMPIGYNFRCWPPLRPPPIDMMNEMFISADNYVEKVFFLYENETIMCKMKKLMI